MAVEYFIGGRYLRSKQKQALISLITFLSVAGVTVGVMALIVVIGVMEGFQEELESQILNVNAHITLQSHQSFTDYQTVLETVEKTPGVESATPIIQTQGMLQAASGYSASYIYGVDLLTADQGFPYLNADPLATHAEKRREDSSLRPGIILGKNLAYHLGTIVGDTVQLISPRSSLLPTGINILPVTRQFQVVGFFESDMYWYDRNLGFISLADAQSLLRKPDETDGIEIRVAEIYEADRIREELLVTLGGYPYAATDWMQKDQNQSYFKALKLEKAVMFIILALIVLVASFNIASTLIMMVMEKRKDIAILRAMGATDKQIRRIFVFKGMVIGLVGTVLGGCLGVALCELLELYRIDLPSDVYPLSYLPVSLQPSDVIVISLTALVICFAATLYPARQASAMNPVEAIRNE